MYNEKIEMLINAALADGELTEKEKQILFKKAEAEGIDLDEFEMVLDARLVELKKREAQQSKEQEIALAKAKAAAQAQPAAPKSNKMGDIKKCPACGAMVSGYQVKCPECGYEFTGVGANSSAERLFNLMIEAKDEEKKKLIIENFPLPATKEDMLEFVASLQPKVGVPDGLESSYYKKYMECLLKIQTFHAQDPIFHPFIESKKTLEKKHNNIGKRSLLNIIFFSKEGNLNKFPIILILFIVFNIVFYSCHPIIEDILIVNAIVIFFGFIGYVNIYSLKHNRD